MLRARGFRSDNASGICPEAWQALLDANSDHAIAYGEDRWTRRAEDLVRELVGQPQAAVYFVFTGTAANSLALASLCPPHGLVACTPAAHILVDECGAPGFFGHGLQLHALPARGGKLDPAAVAAFAALDDVHVGKPAALSVSQCTELGTVYTLAELAALSDAARAGRLAVHVDGARLANACAHLGCTPARVAEAAGADALVVGGTKNGLPGSEALVFRDREAAAEFGFRRKQGGQLASKQRFLAAPWVGVLEGGAWLRHAAHANAMATAVAAAASAAGFVPVRVVEANEVFLPLDDRQAARLAEDGWPLYSEPAWGGYRAVCSWDTREEDVRAFADALAVVRPLAPAATTRS